MPRSAKPQNDRHRFLRDMVHAAGGLTVAGVALGLQRQTTHTTDVRLCLSGALSEETFVNACVRCGQCVQACPYDALKLVTLASGLAAGTPYFVARDISCEICEDIPCVKVYPSGTLGRGIKPIDGSRMGLAVLPDYENCLNYQGLRCDACCREYPKTDGAITLGLDRNIRTGRHARSTPTVHSDACTGCRKCEKVCVPEQPTIKTLPLLLAKGELGHRYRFGWLEGNNGKS